MRNPAKREKPRKRSVFKAFCVHDEQKGASFYGESGTSVHGGDTTKQQIGIYLYSDIQALDNKAPI